uniref:NADH-ubiquinone oxidoreductase chain 2 n=1 Tax=Aguriahana triangularis TaxID=2893144 RepID=A0A9E7BYH4_9HEMI|nr:NADH dehydrogenase subunit 2 [Aguriahana triangularis]UGN61329.1 NADH dehydrogenase subunit 2 [Aguriahana triangularis]
MNSSKMLFLTTMSMGIMMSISSSNWIAVWCGLEISLVSFIPLMINKMMISSESTMKYFIVQSISSAMLMLSMLIMIMKGDYNYDYMLTAALLIKAGVAPFHNWVLTVIEGLDLKMVLIMLTINKIAPITMMSYLSNKMSIIVLLTVVVGATMGLNQNSMKKIIGYSSIFNMGFIMSVLKFNLVWTMYLMIYSMLLFMMVWVLNTYNVNYINQMVFSETIINSMSLWIILLSMGGMPPLMGFSIKYMVMWYLISMNFIFMISVMVMISLLIMFLYLRMTFLSLMNNSLMNKIKLFNSNETSMIFISINMMTLPIMFMIKPYL